MVYSEMQGRENTDSDLCLRAMLRAMYPSGSGYRSETGGIMKNLRESTSNEKVSAGFHFVDLIKEVTFFFIIPIFLTVKMKN